MRSPSRSDRPLARGQGHGGALDLGHVAHTDGAHLHAERRRLPSSLVQLRTAVWTGVTRDTMPTADLCSAVKFLHSITSSAGASSVSGMAQCNKWTFRVVRYRTARSLII